ncbi:MAG: hypothetical protein WBW69_06610 [Candidatus Korobacteraceae bacterium]
MTFVRSLLLCALAILMVVSLATAQAKAPKCVARHYELVPVPLRPAGINNSQLIVGTSEEGRAALWSKHDGLREAEVPSGFTNSEGVGLNDHGFAIGVAINRPTTQRQGFTFSDGKVTLLSGVHSRPFAVNNSGQIAGESQVTGATKSAAVIWDGAKVTPLGDCCASVAHGIDNRGLVIGNIYDKNGRYQAFVWDAARGLRRIGPADAFSSALEMNPAGDIVMQVFPTDLVLYRDGETKRLALSDKRPAAHPRAINSCDVIVGSYGPFGDADRAFVWSEAQDFHDLNDLIAPHPGWVLQAATGINEAGEIVGWAEHNHEDAGFLLIPQP